MIDNGWTTNWPYQKYQVRSRRLQGNIYAAQSKLDEAQAELQHALKLAEQLGNPTQLWKTSQALGNLLFKQGKADQASAEYLKILQVLQRIAEKLADPELIERFLQ